MNKLFKGIIIGSVIGVTISMIDIDNMSKITKRYMKKGRKLIRNMI